MMRQGQNRPLAPDGAEAYFAEISRHFGSGGGFSFEWLMIAAGLVLVVVAGVSLRRWWATRHLRSSPFTVFNRVAGRCELSFSERLLLWRIARQQALPSPLTLLLCPTTMRHHASRFAIAHGRARGAALLRQVARLRRRVFVEI